jgi:GTP diphosphokinase / guanosine-3',5'-bis(diphosphate) 3'-diphosphatase
MTKEGGLVPVARNTEIVLFGKITDSSDRTYLDKALLAAQSYYDGVSRERGVSIGQPEPYINHVARVTGLLLDSGITDRHILASALLHDTVEDGHAELEDIELEFDTEVCDMVKILTHRVGHTEAEYVDQFKIKSKDNPKIKKIKSMSTLIKMADRIDNLTHPKLGREQAKIDETLKYYRGIFQQDVLEILGEDYEAIRLYLYRQIELLVGVDR